MICKQAHIDHRESYRVVRQAGEGFFPNAGYPNKYVLTRSDIQITIQCDHSDVFANAGVVDHLIGCERHINVEAHLLSDFIGSPGQILG